MRIGSMIALCLLFACCGVGLAQQAQITQDGFGLVAGAFGTGIEDRELLGAAESFQIGDRVYFWSRLAGIEDGGIQHVWFLGDREIQIIDLPVGAAQWRTWSYKTLFPGMSGNWRVEVRTATERVLGSYSFYCGD